MNLVQLWDCQIKKSMIYWLFLDPPKSKIKFLRQWPSSPLETFGFCFSIFSYIIFSWNTGDLALKIIYSCEKLWWQARIYNLKPDITSIPWENDIRKYWKSRIRMSLLPIVQSLTSKFIRFNLILNINKKSMI